MQIVIDVDCIHKRFLVASSIAFRYYFKLVLSKLLPCRILIDNLKNFGKMEL